jgi:CRISPR-associated protein Cas1
MGWRSVIITQPAYLSLGVRALQIRQGEQNAQVPLEDISVLVLDNPQITLTGQVLSACAEQGICLITVDATHHPNGIYLPFLSHSRALKVMRAQLAVSVPLRKQLHKALIQAKIRNQAAMLQHAEHEEKARLLLRLADRVRSADGDNMEAQAAQVYFASLFGSGFHRRDECFHNAALNYCYAVIRAALARSLVAYGFLPAFGLFHRNEQNAFNLADDLIEPYRPFVDYWVLRHFPLGAEGDLNRERKALLVAFLHHDIVLNEHGNDGACTVLAGIEATITSLSRIIQGTSADGLCLPVLQAHAESWLQCGRS